MAPSLRRSGCGGHLVGRPAHAPARTRPQTCAGHHATLTALTRHRNRLGDATSTRRIGLLGRACRLHRHAPFHSGQRRVLRLPLAQTSIHLDPPPCEPHANWAFAKALVASASVTRTSHRRDLNTPTTPMAAARRSPTLSSWRCRHPRRTRPRSSPVPRRASERRSHGSWRDGAMA